MPSLREVQRAFADSLLASDDEALAFIALPHAAAAERMAVYRRAFHANYRGALAASYPVVRRLVGVPFFDAAVDAFVRAHPSRSGDLNVYGERFGAFLDDYLPAAPLPYLGDVARLEWAQDEAHRAADAQCSPDAVLAALAAVPADRLAHARVALAPSCRFVASPFPVLRLWQMNQPGADADLDVSPGKGPEALLVRRDAHGIVIERLAHATHAWLATLAGGAGLGSALDAAIAADPAFDVAAVLAIRIADGTLASVLPD